MMLISNVTFPLLGMMEGSKEIAENPQEDPSPSHILQPSSFDDRFTGPIEWELFAL